jgi:hypothetical protein
LELHSDEMKNHIDQEQINSHRKWISIKNKQTLGIISKMTNTSVLLDTSIFSSVSRDYNFRTVTSLDDLYILRKTQLELGHQHKYIDILLDFALHKPVIVLPEVRSELRRFRYVLDLLGRDNRLRCAKRLPSDIATTICDIEDSVSLLDPRSSFSESQTKTYRALVNLANSQRELKKLQIEELKQDHNYSQTDIAIVCTGLILANSIPTTIFTRDTHLRMIHEDLLRYIALNVGRDYLPKNQVQFRRNISRKEIELLKAA